MANSALYMAAATVAAVWLCCITTLVAAEKLKEVRDAEIASRAKLFGTSIDELRKRMGEVLEKADTDGDGIISEAEIRQWAARVKLAMMSQHAAQEMKGFDKDADGFIDIGELRDAHALDVDGVEFTVHGDDATEDLAARFAIADKDKDGRLSPEELPILLNVGIDDAMVELETNIIMRVHDKDNDDKISNNEFYNQTTLSESDKASLDSDFQEYDTDDDSFLSAAEVSKVLRDSYTNEIDAMVKDVQQWGEGGAIDQKAWEEHFSQLSVSGLTDNGELLRYPESYSNLGMSFKNLPTAVHDEL